MSALPEACGLMVHKPSYLFLQAPENTQILTLSSSFSQMAKIKKCAVSDHFTSYTLLVPGWRPLEPHC